MRVSFCVGRRRPSIVIPGRFFIKPARKSARTKEVLAIPAKAGISKLKVEVADPCFRRDDNAVQAGSKAT